jgi:hypothetical protein
MFSSSTRTVVSTANSGLGMTTDAISTGASAVTDTISRQAANEGYFADRLSGKSTEQKL